MAEPVAAVEAAEVDNRNFAEIECRHQFMGSAPISDPGLLMAEIHFFVISMYTSAPLIVSSYVGTFTPAFRVVSPVLGSNSQPCQGQRSLPFSSVPCPSGPPQCGHTLSMAYNSPSRFTTQTSLPSTKTSITLPHSGKSDLVSFTDSIGSTYTSHLVLCNRKDDASVLVEYPETICS
jgi:hypothetical protein